MDGGSVSKLYVILEITGKFKIKCELKRHLSPSLVGTINRSLPVTGTIHMLGTSGVYVESHIESGGERTRKEFKKGDVKQWKIDEANQCYKKPDFGKFKHSKSFNTTVQHHSVNYEVGRSSNKRASTS